MFWIVWYKFVVEDPDVLKANVGWCVGLHILLHYLMLVNYFWMFCEGLHLHLVLVIKV
ncbi:AGAP001175-PA-like protein [Anopheles sinensis]|uniref:AGAP001175-PA-like protein n=1 Tax=Anopheles sinensis TaxID=74873 RepID=A0A084W0G7_ANOSI|nr:AGAP001175-PA-like protein [Anopheles sinensis]